MGQVRCSIGYNISYELCCRSPKDALSICCSAYPIAANVLVGFVAINKSRRRTEHWYRSFEPDDVAGVRRRESTLQNNPVVLCPVRGGRTRERGRGLTDSENRWRLTPVLIGDTVGIRAA